MYKLNKLGLPIFFIPLLLIRGPLLTDLTVSLSAIIFLIFTVINKTYHHFNSNSWWFPIKNNQVFLFPSKTVHSVDLKPEDNVRTSLAFNVFVKGTFGYTDNLTELILK